MTHTNEIEPASHLLSIPPSNEEIDAVQARLSILVENGDFETVRHLAGALVSICETLGNCGYPRHASIVADLSALACQSLDSAD